MITSHVMCGLRVGWVVFMGCERQLSMSGLPAVYCTPEVGTLIVLSISFNVFLTFFNYQVSLGARGMSTKK